jgi:hypothetical protein
MKKLLLLLVVALSGCVVADPYYVQPTYVQPRPVYVQPRPIYVQPPPRCYWVQQWNGYTRSYQNVRVCR